MYSENIEYTQNGAGQYTFIGAIVGQQVDITYTVSYGASWLSALDQLGLSLATGRLGQPVWSWLQTFSPSQALAYSGMAYCYASDYALTNQAELENHSFEVITGHSVSSTVPDCWPDVILRDFLVTNPASVGWRAGRLASMQGLKDYVRARQLWISVSMEEQRPAREWLEALAEICNAKWTWQGGLLDLVPRGDEAISSSYGSFTPDITPAFDLVYGEGGDILQPVEITPKVNEDAFNIIKIEWTNRANNYAIEIMTATDVAHIELFGERPKDVIKMHAIHDPAVAQSVAQQVLQREMTVWNEYRFKCPFSRALISLMSLQTLTDASNALSRTPVRIIAREEDGSDQYTYTAEDAPIGSASAPIYGSQAGSGFGHDYNAAPGNVVAPTIFEAPTERSSTGLEVYAAVTGSDPLWGGCRVWVSLDGLNYKDMGRLYGGSRYGTLTATMGTSGNAAVQLVGQGGQMLSGSSQDAAALSTLCWVAGSSGGEYFAYETATLTGPSAYTLSSLMRGAYQNVVQTHTSGQAFVRIDDAIATSGPLTDEIIGQAISFKFTSFNVYGGAEQSLADVAAYSYTVTGEQLSLPPPNVSGAALTLTTEGVRASWEIFEGDYKDTWLRKGASWGAATPLGAAGEIQRAGTSYLVGWLPAGTTSVVFKHRDRRNVESVTAASASIVISNPSAVTLVRADVEANFLTAQWGDCKTSQPILRYAYRLGTTAQAYADATPYGSAGADSRSDVIRGQTAGTFRVWFVAIDVAGNESTPTFVDVTFTLPTDFTLAERFDATFAGTGTNVTVNDGRVYLLMLNEADGTHFSSRGWANDSDAIAAGSPLYFQPGTTTASYQEEYDLGAVVPTTTIVVTQTVAWLAGSGTIETDIAYKKLIGDPWTTVSNVATLIASDLQYIRITVRAIATGNDDLAQLTAMFTECGLRRIYEPFTLMLNAGDVGGTPYVTTTGFSDIQSATANAQDGSGIVRGPYYTIDDSGPTKRVLWTAFDNTGTRIGGQISGQISGV